MSELAGCPFCGNAPVAHWVGHEDEGYFEIACETCNGSSGNPFCGVHGESREECEPVWNRRAVPDLFPLYELVERWEHASEYETRSCTEAAKELRAELATLERAHG